MLSASTLNVTKLRIVSDATSRLVLAHMDAPALLKKHPFLPIDDTPQERSFGWCAWGEELRAASSGQTAKAPRG